MSKDYSQHPLSEDSDNEQEGTQERQLSSQELIELERNDLRNALVMDGLQDLENSLDALASPFDSGMIQDDAEVEIAVSPSNAQDAAPQTASADEDSDLANSALVDVKDLPAGVNLGKYVADATDINLDDVIHSAADTYDQVDQYLEKYDGYRIHRVDVYNWSSFNNNVKTVYFGGRNTLMTGDNGAGKSSVIDAITILLYDLQKITFNQAAGAEKGERNLASYVWGLYKNDNLTGVKTEHGLRSNQGAVLSIISATFYNRAQKKYVVLVQCLSINRNKSAPDRHYYIGDRDFNLQEDVLPVKDIRELGKRLTALGCVRYKTFREYSITMQETFGIRRTKVLDLFYKTISMKSISNISDFVRKQMLEDFSGEELIDDLIDRVEDLNQSYQAVEEAQHQIDALAPIVEKGQAYAQIGERKQFIRDCSMAANPYLFKKKAEFLEKDIETYTEQVESLQKEQESYKEKIKDVENNLTIITQELAAQGGDRQNTIKQQIAHETKERNRIERDYNQYAACLQSLGFEPIDNAEDFADLPKRLDKLQGDLTKSKETYENNQVQVSIELDKLKARESEVSTEIQSLRSRKNNIPHTHVRVREQICNAIGCDEKDLPFVGELIRIKDSEKLVWEKAVEKVLHTYAISMLVTEEYYSQVVHYVHTHDIGMRLVFNRIKERDLAGSQALNNAFGSRMSNIQQVGSNSLVRKLDFKEDPRFQTYLRQTLERNYNYVCTESEQEYRSEVAALMPSGLCKKGARNEKDDRRRTGNDFVLGWTNEDKLATLTRELTRIKVETDSYRNNLRTIKDGLSTVSSKLNMIDRVREVDLFDKIDVKSHDAILERLNNELIEIQRTSDIIATLSKRQDELQQDKIVYQSRLQNAIMDCGKATNALEHAKKEHETALCISVAAENLSEEVIAELESCIEEAMRVLHFIELDVSKIDPMTKEVSSKLEKRYANLQEEETNLGSEIVNMQTKFATKYVVLSRNLDANRASSWVDFNTLYEKLKEDDLPKYLDAFRYKLSTDTLDQFATINAKYNSDRRAIQDRIEQINEIMYEVDFNPNHYIKMVATDTTDLEIQQFRNDLKRCSRGSIDGFSLDTEAVTAEGAAEGGEQAEGSEKYGSSGFNLDFSNFNFEKAEEKFLEVKALIDRLKAGSSINNSIDYGWRRKVTDVKRWFNFSASEHSREDDSQVDYYEDSGGKSGGQKEKLAYTVLASSLAYQYKSRQARNNNGFFRFVIIDEAFGRSSPQSVDYALTLFDKFDLQLLVATPMQKLDVIEKFVNHVAFVFRNEDTNESTIINYELQDYILKRKLREQIKKVKALGKEADASIMLSSSNGDVSLTVDQVEQLVQDLDQRIHGEQDRYTGPSQGKPTKTEQVNVKVGEEGQLIEAPAETAKPRGSKKTATIESDEDWAKLQETGSLMHMVNKEQVQSQLDKSVTKAPEAKAESNAIADSGLDINNLTAEEIEATKALELERQKAQGQHISAEERLQRELQEARAQHQQVLGSALDKLKSLESYDIEQAQKIASARAEKEALQDPMDLSAMAFSEGLTDDSGDDTAGGLVIDAKTIQKENRTLEKWSKDMVTTEQQDRYKVDDSKD